MTRKFADRGQQEIYELYRADPPKRRGAGGLAAAYWRGLDHPSNRFAYDMTSLAHAAWTAGVETAREGEKQDAA